MDALDDPACCIYDPFFQKLLLYGYAGFPVRRSCVHTNGKGWTCSGIPVVGLLHAQIPTAHTLAALFLSVLSCTFCRFLFVESNFLCAPSLAQVSNWVKLKFAAMNLKKTGQLVVEGEALTIRFYPSFASICQKPGLCLGRVKDFSHFSLQTLA